MKDSLRVCFVVSRFPKFTETFVLDAISGLEAEGLDVQIFPLQPIEPLPHQPAAAPFAERARFGPLFGPESAKAFTRVLMRHPRALLGVIAALVRQAWNEPNMLAKDLAQIPRICVIAETVAVDGTAHVHAHFATRAGFAAWAIGRITGLPYSIVGHGSDIHRTQTMLATKASEADAMILVSDFNRAVVEAALDGRPANLLTIHCGVDVSSFDATPVERTGAPALLCVGTLHEVKGQAILLEAIAELHRRGMPLTARFIGDGPDREMLERQAADLGLTPSIEFSGALPRDQVVAAYRDCAVVVAPSVATGDGRKEGIPVVLMEAMASGTPVIASDLAGIPELVSHGRTGLLALPGSATSLADQIEFMLEDPDRSRELGAEGRRWVETAFNAPRSAASIAAIIRKGAA